MLPKVRHPSISNCPTTIWELRDKIVKRSAVNLCQFRITELRYSAITVALLWLDSCVYIQLGLDCVRAQLGKLRPILQIVLQLPEPGLIPRLLQLQVESRPVLAETSSRQLGRAFRLETPSRFREGSEMPRSPNQNWSQKHLSFTNFSSQSTVKLRRRLAETRERPHEETSFEILLFIRIGSRCCNGTDRCSTPFALTWLLSSLSIPDAVDTFYLLFEQLNCNQHLSN